MKGIIYILTGLVVLGLLACEETVTLDTKQIDPQIVIEGLVTDETKSHYVRVTRSVGFYDFGRARGVADAVVTVSDNEGNVFNYVHNPGDMPESDGYYYAETPFAGEVGNTYTLTVIVGGETYTGSDVLQPVTAIDSLSVRIDEDEFEDPEDVGYYHEVLFYAKEPKDRKDYYLFKFYRNDSIILDQENDIYFANDEVLGENIDGIPIAGFYKNGDVARVEMYSITRQGYVYYNDLFNILNNDGGMFSPPPANPRTNLSNDALGFFQVSAMVSKSIVIE
ncbi:DUF4249 domain-containing protein [Fulvivirga imtechensis]|uniref:DUF4249 domain-containing protein n=1 Tax=Fulvivirga imtechensis TaxID=881893 RepID=UPI00058EA868|nr:DUF4249 domain-containing protein [Fulvivirga imtechensis]